MDFGAYSQLVLKSEPFEIGHADLTVLIVLPGAFHSSTHLIPADLVCDTPVSPCHWFPGTLLYVPL